MNDVDALRAAITGLSLSVPRWVEEIDGGDPVALVLLLDDLRRLRQELHTVEAYAEAEAARAMPGRRLDLPDGRTAERSGGYARKDWQHGRLLVALWADCVAEKGGDLDAAAELLRDRVLGAAHIDYWRAKDLAQLGVDVGDYSTREKARRTVRISAKPAGGGGDAA